MCHVSLLCSALYATCLYHAAKLAEEQAERREAMTSVTQAKTDLVTLLYIFIFIVFDKGPPQGGSQGNAPGDDSGGAQA